MKPLQQGYNVTKTKKQIQEMADHHNVTFQEMCILFKEIEDNETVWLNNKYVVNVRDMPAKNDFPPIRHLSIRRKDRKAVRDWRDFQAIKNQLCGEECEGVELYPAESRLVDTANQFHLWVLLDSTSRFPFGFHEGRKVDGVSTGGAVQRPLKG